MARRTPNGRTARLPKGEFLSNSYRLRTDDHDESLRRAQDNAEETAKNRSAETTERQKNAKQERQDMEARMLQLEKELTDKSKALKDELINSFKEKGIKETLKDFSSDLKAYKELSDEHLAINAKTRNIKTLSLFNEFMLNIAQEYPDFIVFLPEDCFVHAESTNRISLTNLKPSELAILQEKFEKSGVIDNEIFKKYYLRYFPKYINRLSTQKDIRTALSIDPSAYTRFKGANHDVLFENINLFNDLVNRVPQILLYAPNEEIALLAKSHPAAIGLAISRCPEILEKLSNDFFKTYQPKYIFAKTESKHAAQAIINESETLKEKLPILAEYFNNSRIRVVGPRPKKPTYEFVPPTDPLDF